MIKYISKIDIDMRLAKLEQEFYRTKSFNERPKANPNTAKATKPVSPHKISAAKRKYRNKNLEMG